MSELCPSALIESDLKVHRHRLEVYLENSYPASSIKQEQKLITQLEYQLKISKDYENNPITHKPPFEEPQQFDIGFIPTLGELSLAFQQMPPNWPGETYRHELKLVVDFNIQVSGISTNEKSLGYLTFNKIDGKWVYFGPTKYK